MEGLQILNTTGADACKREKWPHMHRVRILFHGAMGEFVDKNTSKQQTKSAHDIDSL